MASGYDNERYSCRTDAALGVLPTDHLSSVSFYSGTWGGCDQMLNREGDSALEQVKTFSYISGFFANSTSYYFKGCSFISPQLPKGYGSRTDGLISFQNIIQGFTPPRGVSVYLGRGIFLIDGEGNLKHTLQDDNTMSISQGATKYSYSGTISYTGAAFDIAWGDRLVIELWGKLTNNSGRTAIISKANIKAYMGQPQATGSDFAFRFDPIQNVSKPINRLRGRK